MGFFKNIDLLSTTSSKRCSNIYTRALPTTLCAGLIWIDSRLFLNGYRRKSSTCVLMYWNDYLSITLFSANRQKIIFSTALWQKLWSEVKQLKSLWKDNGEVCKKLVQELGSFRPIKKYSLKNDSWSKFGIPKTV